MIFVNNGRITHTVAAQDGGWSSPSLDPARSFYVTSDEPETCVYRCTEHPWATGEVIGEP